MDSSTKLILGTVQFGLNYGVNNQSGQVSKESVETILSLASNKGIKILDTSSAYGTSEKVLGEVLNENDMKFRIISKYPRSSRSVKTIFEESLYTLNQKKLYGYLIHHFDFFRKKQEIWRDFLLLKEEGKVTKIGFSLYNVDELKFLLDRDIAFDILQFPYNIFDRQFEKFFPLLKERNVETHVRSVFLQGLFFKPLKNLEGKLLPLRKYVESLHSYCKVHCLKIEELALGYVYSSEYTNGVLIGVDTIEQLESNIKNLGYNISPKDIDFVRSIEIKEKELLSPVNWK
ncbi:MULTISPECIES: aldo/keto reductase [Butyricimonas]|uniref:aldo/keto reductase n=1 Tax=Butyricimonas TaxID=574697 RepID=UPI0020826F27|nr:aldo/keto reductase [Butyricimonas paravirosa]BDF55665.1 oxidoreductase [Odoribacteraceae bacterium]GKH94530.1 oxidoreductase [Odoribacteraceae bacterium]GKI00556.1 oxidoreductase [Odoribacteraceae bacterium]GKI02052.1 oxidoreductase [Odoribacteraceae bacterium]